MSQPGETDGFSLSDHVKAIEGHAGEGLIDIVLASTTDIPEEILERYRKEGSEPIEIDRENIKKALQSIFRYNWKQDFSEFPNPQRVYVMNDEKGLVLCSWPKEGRPRFPFPYSDEVWYGIEYQVACTMIYHGMIEQGLSIVKALRDRHNGKNRNPWNEVECGNHYARCLASYGLILALSGFQYDGAEKRIRFSPCVNREDFRCFFSVEGAWGVYRQERNEQEKWEISIDVHQGQLELREFIPGTGKEYKNVECLISDKKIEAKQRGETIRFSDIVKIKAGTSLLISLTE